MSSPSDSQPKELGMSRQDQSVYLVPCASRKGRTPAPARDLYQSALFLKMRGVVEELGVPWFILSAKHGLVRPEQVVEPYDQTLNELPVSERRAWARRVIGQMEISLPQADRIVVFAGQKYREFLTDWLQARATVETPLAHLGIGKQLQYLDACLDGAFRGGRSPAATTHGNTGLATVVAEPTTPGRRAADTSDPFTRPSKYDPLRDFLRGHSGEAVELSFPELAQIVGGLPRSAYAYRPWWANNRSHPQAKAWLEVGYEAVVDWTSRKVRFYRRREDR